MLEKATLKGFVPTTDADRARRFYVDVLWLEFIDDDPFAVTVRHGLTPIRIVRLPTFSPAAYTILGWDVTDIRSCVSQLARAGISLLRYEGMQQDDDGIWTAPGGSMVAWFHDPDGNVLSVSEHPPLGQES